MEDMTIVELLHQRADEVGHPKAEVYRRAAHRIVELQELLRKQGGELGLLEDRIADLMEFHLSCIQ